MKKFLFIATAIVIVFITLLSFALGNSKVIMTPLEDSTDSDKPRAILQNHTSYGPSIINKAYIENTTQIYGPFTAEDNYFNKLVVYGPLDIAKSEIREAFIYGPAKVSNSDFSESLTIFGPLMAKSCMFKNINATADKIFIENSHIETIKILQDAHDDDKQQALYLRGNVKIKNIEFESGKGIIFITSKGIDLKNTKIIGAEVKERFS